MYKGWKSKITLFFFLLFFFIQKLMEREPDEDGSIFRYSCYKGHSLTRELSVRHLSSWHQSWTRCCFLFVCCCRMTPRSHMVCLTTLTGPTRPALRRHHSGDNIFLSSDSFSRKIALEWHQKRWYRRWSDWSIYLTKTL